MNKDRSNKEYEAFRTCQNKNKFDVYIHDVYLKEKEIILLHDLKRRESRGRVPDTREAENYVKMYFSPILSAQF